MKGSSKTTIRQLEHSNTAADRVMGMATFNPYEAWLGIPLSEQPANHYRLLGIVLLEDDVEVIRAAADKRMARVQQHANGPHGALSQQILNELAQALVTLLDSTRKVEYDQKYLAELDPPAAGVTAMAGSSTPQEHVPTAVAAEDIADERTFDEWAQPGADLPPRLTDKSHRLRTRLPPRTGHASSFQADSSQESRSWSSAMSRLSRFGRRLARKARRSPRLIRLSLLFTLLICLIGLFLRSRDEVLRSALPGSTAVSTNTAAPIPLPTPPSTAPPSPTAVGVEATLSQSDATSIAPPPGPNSNDLEGTYAGEVRTFTELQIPFSWCPPGDFVMGSPATLQGRSGNENQVQVELSGLWMGQTELTQGVWESVMGTRPWFGESSVKEGPMYPATYVNWDDASELCRQLTARERAAGRLPADWFYSLPTEAQWEYACRAETKSPYNNDGWGSFNDYAWYENNTRDVGEGYAHLVGQKTPNRWGLFDMHGNVDEWCQDYYVDRLPGGRAPVVTSGGSTRVLRGGSWSGPISNCRSSIRHQASPSVRHPHVSLRLAISSMQGTSAPSTSGSRVTTNPQRRTTGTPWKTIIGQRDEWRKATVEPQSASWSALDFDDSSWRLEPGPFGCASDYKSRPGCNTRWISPKIWLRRVFVLPNDLEGLEIQIDHQYDGNLQWIVNGRVIKNVGNWLDNREVVTYSVGSAETATFRPGRNVFAVYCANNERQAKDPRLVDLIVRWRIVKSQ